MLFTVRRHCLARTRLIHDMQHCVQLQSLRPLPSELAISHPWRMYTIRTLISSSASGGGSGREREMSRLSGRIPFNVCTSISLQVPRCSLHLVHVLLVSQFLTSEITVSCAYNHAHQPATRLPRGHHVDVLASTCFFVVFLTLGVISASILLLGLCPSMF